MDLINGVEDIKKLIDPNDAEALMRYSNLKKEIHKTVHGQKVRSENINLNVNVSAEAEIEEVYKMIKNNSPQYPRSETTEGKVISLPKLPPINE